MSKIYDIAEWRDYGRQRDTVVSRWVAGMDRGLTDDEIDELLAWTSLDPRNEQRLLDLARLWDRMDILAQLRNLMPFPIPDKPR